MNKYIKYLIVLIFGIILSTPLASADDPTTVQKFKEAKEKRESIQLNEKIVKSENKIASAIVQTEDIQKIETVSKEQVKRQMEAKKELLKATIEKSKLALKNQIAKIKDEKKKAGVEKITTKVTELNAKATENLLDINSKIELILFRIKSKTENAKAKGLAVTDIEEKIAEAEKSLTDSKNAIVTQSVKIYSINIKGDSTVKTTMGSLMKNFTKDINSLRDKIKYSHEKVKDAAKLLSEREGTKTESPEKQTEVEAQNETTSN